MFNMFNRLDALQTGLAILFMTSIALVAGGLLYLGYKEIMKVIKERKKEISFNDIHNVLSENEISINQATKTLNDYKS